MRRWNRKSSGWKGAKSDGGMNTQRYKKEGRGERRKKGENSFVKVAKVGQDFREGVIIAHK